MHSSRISHDVLTALSPAGVHAWVSALENNIPGTHWVAVKIITASVITSQAYIGKCLSPRDITGSRVGNLAEIREIPQLNESNSFIA